MINIAICDDEWWLIHNLLMVLSTRIINFLTPLVSAHMGLELHIILVQQFTSLLQRLS